MKKKGKKKKEDRSREEIERAQSHGRKLWFARSRRTSVYEKVQRRLTRKSRTELLEWFQKLESITSKDETKAKETYPKFSQAKAMTNEELIEVLAQIESNLRIDTDKRTQSALTQNRKRFTGRQKGRALRSFP